MIKLSITAGQVVGHQRTVLGKYLEMSEDLGQNLEGGVLGWRAEVDPSLAAY